MKKLLICLLVVLASFFSLVGCANEEDVEGDYYTKEELIALGKANTKSASQAIIDDTVTGTPNFTVPTGGYDGSDVTIKFYHTMGSNLSDVLDRYITEFYKIYPNITVEWEQVGGYDDVRNQISTEITTGGQPDLAYCYPDHVALYNLSDAVATLDNLIDSQESDGNDGIIGLTQDQKDDFIKAYYDEGRQFGDGLMYSMPFSKSTEVLYYNKTFFTEHNIEVPTHWFTESETDTTSMEYVCAKIQEIDPYSIPLGYDSESNWFITMCEQIGSEYTSATGKQFRFYNKTNASLWAQFRLWARNNWVTTSTLYGTYTSGLFVSTTNPKSYMSIGSSAGATHQRPSADGEGKYPFEVGIASIPQMNPENPKVISQGPSVCIFNNSNPQKVIASWLFLKFLITSVKFQAEFSIASGYVPVIKSVANVKVYKDFFLDLADGGDYIAALAAKTCLEQESAYYTSPAFNGSSTAREQVGYLVAAVLSSNTKTPNKFIVESFEKYLNKCTFYYGE